MQLHPRMFKYSAANDRPVVTNSPCAVPWLWWYTTFLTLLQIEPLRRSSLFLWLMSGRYNLTYIWCFNKRCRKMLKYKTWSMVHCSEVWLRLQTNGLQLHSFCCKILASAYYLNWLLYLRSKNAVVFPTCQSLASARLVGTTLKLFHFRAWSTPYLVITTVRKPQTTIPW